MELRWREATPEEALEIAGQAIKRGLAEIERDEPDLEHIALHLRDAEVWLRGAMRTGQEKDAE